MCTRVGFDLESEWPLSPPLVPPLCAMFYPLILIICFCPGSGSACSKIHPSIHPSILHHMWPKHVLAAKLTGNLGEWDPCPFPGSWGSSSVQNWDFTLWTCWVYEGGAMGCGEYLGALHRLWRDVWPHRCSWDTGWFFYLPSSTRAPILGCWQA